MITMIVMRWIARVSIAVLTVVLTAGQPKTDLESFELIWSTLRSEYWDASMAKLDWQAIHEQYLQELQAAKDTNEARAVMSRMIHRLPSSHLAIIPGWAYDRADTPASTPAAASQRGNDAGEGVTGLTAGLIAYRVVVESVEADSGAAKSGVHPGWIIERVDGKSTRDLLRSLGEEPLIPDIVEQWLSGPLRSTVNVSFTTSGKTEVRSIEREAPPGELAQFGNLPPERIRIEHRKLEDGVGYIRLNLFLDPLLVMPEIEKAIEEFRSAPGIVLDLRNNPGGIGAMAMGISGWFVAKDGLRLGTMTSRDSTTNFIINPRLHPYQGRLAILVNAGSASTSEILAQGLRDLGRARIFGTRSAGAALPSNIIELPNGDRFQYPVASYVSMKGKALEGNGVAPDVVVAATIPALLEGRDLPLEAARVWSRQK
jgi:carboxyl-terminal processing protease